jgi:diguanylate cyclase (GGDEF)-like protein/PAS domain S-box-containing protein
LQKTVPENMMMARESLLGRLMRLALSATSENVERSVCSALRLLCEFYGAERAILYDIKADGSLQRAFEWSVKGLAPLDISRQFVRADEISPWLEDLNSGLSLHVPPPAYGDSPHIAPSTLEQDAALLVPLLGKDHLSSVLSIAAPRRALRPEEDETGLLAMVADLLLSMTQQAVPRPDAPANAGSDVPDEIRNAALWAMPDLIFELDSEGRFCRIISPDTPRGHDAPDDTVGLMLEDVLPADVARDLRGYMAEIDENDRVQGRIQRVSGQKHSIWYEVSGSHCAPRRRGEALGYLLVMRDITARIEGEAELKRLGRIVELMTNLVAIIDHDGCVVWTNAAFETHSGYVIDEIRGRDFKQLVTGPDSNRSVALSLRHAVMTERGYEGEDIHYTKDGTPYWVTFNMQPLNDSRGKLSGFVFVETVITKQRKLEIALRNERDFLSTLTETSVSAIVVCNGEGKCIFTNSEAKRLLATFPRDAQDRVDSWPLHQIYAGPSQGAALPFGAVARSPSAVRNLTFSLRLPGRPRRIYSVNTAPLHTAKTEGQIVVTLTDVTAQFEADEAKRQVASKAQHEANHDLLTDLPNRRNFNTKLSRALASKSVDVGDIHVLVVDMDNFKRIRTVLGQDVGDAMICLIAQRIRDVLGGSDRLARTDSDCFVAFMVSEEATRASELATRICQAIAEPCELDKMTVYATASIGISQMKDRAVAPEMLIRQAELAIETAKAAGGNRHAHYSPGMEIRISRSSEIVQALRLALRQDQFELAFQPKFSLEDGHRLVGAEALLRLQSSRLGWVGPDEFILVAETAGMITEIDFHVMSLFTRQMGAWRRRGHCVPASLNLSPRSFENPTLAQRFLEMLAQEEIAPQDVTVEITETSLVSTSGHALANIDAFRRGGIHISVDDFGTGYSSLSYLQRLIATEVKIDKSFIQPLIGPVPTPETEVLLRAILTLANTFGLKTVAEGVETVDQMRWLKKAGCLMIQGYLGGRAVTPEVFEQIHLARGAMQIADEPSLIG